MREVTVTHKLCPMCHETKTADGFYRLERSASGLASRCKACQSRLSAQWNQKNRERHLALKVESGKRRRRETAKEGSPCVVYSVDGMSKWCPHCKARKSILAFQKNKEGSIRRTHSWCRDCEAEEQAKVRASVPYEMRQTAGTIQNLRRKGLSIEEFYKLNDLQSGVCAICHNPPKNTRLFVDHDHSCCPDQSTCGKCSRGLLCSHCNGLLHRLENTPGWMQKALEYLQQHQRIVNA